MRQSDWDIYSFILNATAVYGFNVWLCRDLFLFTQKGAGRATQKMFSNVSYYFVRCVCILYLFCYDYLIIEWGGSFFYLGLSR